MSKLTALIMFLSTLLTAPLVLADSASDAKITAEVQHVLARGAETDDNKINVHTQDGVVQLSGFVDSGRLKAAATASAKSVRGVKEVRNDLIIREGERTLAQGAQDTVIASKVRQTLASQKHEDVRVDVRSGVVQLSGFADSAASRTEAERAVRRIEGVAEVRNDIEIVRR